MSQGIAHSTADTIRSSARESIQLALALFGNRQVLYYATRGVVSGLLVGVAGVLAIVMLDYMQWLPDVVRWTATCGMYLAVAVTLWVRGLKRMFYPPTAVVLASEVESLHPTFRESLLSSVELRDQEGRPTSGAAAFVSAVEQKAAGELAQINVKKLVPWAQLRKGQLTLAGWIVMVMALCFVPSLQMKERLGRALFPFMDIEAPSQWYIAVISPSDSYFRVPADQVIEFTIEVDALASGVDFPESAILEWRETNTNAGASNRDQRKNDPEVQRFPMRKETGAKIRYSTQAPIGDREIRYRFLLSDTKTSWRTIAPVERPSVIRFFWNIQPPSYTEQAAVEKNSKRGDIQVLKGSEVRLRLDVNQELKDAQLVLEYPTTGQQSTIALSKSAQKISDQSQGAKESWEASWIADQNARYQIRLASAFQFAGDSVRNTFSPWYKIESLEDTPANIQWISTEQTLWSTPPRPNDSWIVANDEWITIAGSIQDNIPIRSLSAEISVNGGAWQTVDGGASIPWEKETEDQDKADGGLSAGFKAKAAWKWDVAKAKAISGDLVSLRWVARDKADQISYSPVLAFSISNTGFSRDRHASMIRRSELVTPLQRLADQFQTQRDTIRPILEQLRDRQLATDIQEKHLKALDAWMAATDKVAEEAEAAGKRILPTTARYVDQLEVELALRMVSKIRREFLGTVRYGSQREFLDSIREAPTASHNWYVQDRDEKVGRMLAAWDAGHENAIRLNDVYRSFLGYELQTCLTKDMTLLQEYQTSQVQAKTQKDLPALIRSQRVAQQYWDAANDVADQMLPHVNRSLSDRLPQWIDAMANSRHEIRDLCDQDGDANVEMQLRNRIARDSNELKNMRWLFNYDGGLMWSIGEMRKELLHRSGSLRSVFDQFFDRNERRKRVMQEKSLSSEDTASRLRWILAEVELPIRESLEQMLDRRDFHQLRLTNDPLFAADMGMAWRAWNAVLERWKTEPNNLDSLASDLSLIASAYRVLDAAHEMVDARTAVKTLQNVEQYDFSTIEGQLNHYGIFESISPKIDFAMSLMQNAAYPQGVPEKYAALRWGDPMQQIQQKLNLRRNANNSSLISTASHAQEIMEKWEVYDALAQPKIDEARAILARFAPSIQELARKAAQETKSLEELTKKIAEKDNTTKSESNPSNEPPPTVQQLDAQREEANQRTEELQDALIENANRQDLLKESDLQKAQDSDRALQLLDKVIPQMNEALDEAMEAIAAAAQPKSPVEEASDSERDAKSEVKPVLNNALQKEERATQALEAIAKHFESDPSARSQASDLEKLAQQAMREQSLSPNTQDDASDRMEQYQKAEELAKMANAKPEEVLRELEKELKSDPIMQQELSAISKNNANSAASELKSAAQSEDLMARRLENEDASLLEAKLQEVEKLRSVADQADRLAARLLEKAAQMSARSGERTPDMAAISQASASLRNSSQQARNTNETSTSKEIADAAAKLAKEIVKTAEDAQSLSSNMEKQISLQKEKDEQKRTNKVNEARNAQNALRDELQQWSKQLNDQWTNEKNRVQKRLEQTQKEIEVYNQQREQAAQNAARNPKDANAQNWLQRSNANVDQAVARQKQMSKTLETVTRVQEQLANQSKQLAEKEKANLDQPNPYAALAEEQLQKSQSILNNLAEQVKEIAKSASELPAPKTPESTLGNVAENQSKLNDRVDRVAQDLARSARHEERLGNEKGEKALSEQSQKIERTADGTLQKTSETLNNAAQSAKQAEIKGSQSGDNQPQTIDRPSTETSRSSLQQAQKELEQLAQGLERSLENSQPSLPPSQGAPSANGKSSESGKSNPGTPNQNASDDSASPTSSPNKPNTASDKGASGSSSSPNGNNGQRDPSESQSNSSSVPNQSSSPSGSPSNASGAEREQATERARMLDQLDRELFAPSSPSETGDSKRPGEQDTSRSESNSDTNQLRDTKGNMSSAMQSHVEASAQKLSSEMNQQRLQQRNRSPIGQTFLRDRKGALNPSSVSGPGMPRDQLDDYLLPNGSGVNRREWGKLRTQKAEQVIEGRRESFDPEFDQAIQAYYKALGTSPAKP